MSQYDRANKYMDLFIDAINDRKMHLKRAKDLRDKATKGDGFGYFFTSKAQYFAWAKIELDKARKAKAAQRKIHRTLISILGVLNSEK